MMGSAPHICTGVIAQEGGDSNVVKSGMGEVTHPFFFFAFFF